MKMLYINSSYDFSRGVNANRVLDLLNYFAKEKFVITHLVPVEGFRVKGLFLELAART